jgi:two-component system response regulator DctR
MRAHEALRRERALAEDLAARLAQLTPREREVMHLVVSGEHNKGIADALSIAVRTVEVHRAHVFDKMGVRSAVELAGLLARSR